ncbi:hypothetical protein BSFA1_24410 [Burkholderia sp. SFA1]|nr:hypothetical protein BSFA1_24410 [Burkholderia sp. SFA1]
MDIRAVSKSFICLRHAAAGLTFAMAKHDKASRATLLRRSEKDLTRRQMLDRKGKNDGGNALS